MLGSIKPKQTAWLWGATGKHPVARDFIRLGVETPLLKALSDWVESGYKMLGSRPNHVNSWRFWAKGIKRNELVCGLLRDSFDSLGRPFPFLIVGAGILEGWEDKWEVLPYVLDAQWNRMEYVCAKKAFDLNSLESDLRLIPVPVFAQTVGMGCKAAQAGDLPREHDGQFFVELGPSVSSDPVQAMCRWHYQFKVGEDGVPNAAFIGGAQERIFLVLYMRSLASRDFKRMWSVCQDGVLDL